MPSIVQLRRGTNAERLAVVFSSGEPVYTTDTKKLFIGDGSTVGGIDVTAWSKITSTPTTLAGYGIIDAAANASVVHLTGNETVAGEKLLTSKLAIDVASGTVQEWKISGVSKLLLDGSGNLGIGGIAAQRLNVFLGSLGGAAASFGTSQPYGISRYQHGNAVLDIGGLAAGQAWIQATDATDLSANYDLSLQPNGGSVGVGLVPTAGNGLLQLASGTTKANGIAFGADCFIHRFAVNHLRVGDAGTTPIFELFTSSNVIPELRFGQAGIANQISLGANGEILEIRHSGTLNISASSTTLGFFGNRITKPTVSGSRGGNAALASLLTALSNYGLITDSTTA